MDDERINRRVNSKVRGIDYRHVQGIRLPTQVRCQATKPILGSDGLPILRAAGAAIRGGRDTDRVEVVAANTGEGAGFESSYCRGLPAAGCSGHDNNARDAHGTRESYSTAAERS